MNDFPLLYIYQCIEELVESLQSISDLSVRLTARINVMTASFPS
jgi:hypothetical protein